MTSTSVAIGIDLDTSSVKVVALSSTGTTLARAKRGYATLRPVPGAAEQHPSEWISAIVGALTELGAAVDPALWRVIGLTAMLPTLVALDAKYQPVGVAITWEDGRAEAEADAFRLKREPGLYERTGQRVDGRYLLPMFARLLRDEPEMAARTAIIAGAKDYLFAVLTEELLTDPSTASGYGCFNLQSGTWEGDRADAPELPDVAPSTTTGALVAGFAAVIGATPGIPVVLGAADSVLGAYGLGAYGLGAEELRADEPEDLVYIAGTSTVILGRSEQLCPDPQQRYLITPMADRGFGAEMDLLSTGSALGWLAQLLAVSDVDAMIAAAAEVDPNSAPVFLPYLGPGEQGALWSPSLRGTLFGLTLASTGPQIARGLLNGILVESLRCVRVLEAAGAGVPLSGQRQNGRILVSGSSAASPAFRQDLADATGRTVHFSSTETDHSAIGAAAFAASTIGLATARPRCDFATTAPNTARFELWSELAQRFDEHRLSVQEESLML
jgi:xylulokinase